MDGLNSRNVKVLYDINCKIKEIPDEWKEWRDERKWKWEGSEKMVGGRSTTANVYEQEGTHIKSSNGPKWYREEMSFPSWLHQKHFDSIFKNMGNAQRSELLILFFSFPLNISMQILRCYSSHKQLCSLGWQYSLRWAFLCVQAFGCVRLVSSGGIKKKGRAIVVITAWYHSWNEVGRYYRRGRWIPLYRLIMKRK